MKTTMQKTGTLILLLAVVMSLLAGCGQTETPAPAPTSTTAPTVAPTATTATQPAEASNEAALTLSGDGIQEVAWTMAQLQAMDVVTVNAAQPDKDAKDYDGVRLNALLDLAGVGGSGALTIVADDGYEAEMSLEDARACADCLVGFQSTQGGLRMVMPEMGGNVWVKGVVAMRVQAAEAAPAESTEPEYVHADDKLILATTTSTENSGLLSYILPDFEDEYGVTVQVVAVGTGQALKLGEDGNADVLLVHARAREDAFVEAGFGVDRQDVMYNDFIIAGPADDPAGATGMTDAVAALTMIADAEAPFVSRGDDSGTHTKEKAIWTAAGIEPAGDWYISAGQGMGAVLTMSDEQQAYTLTDRATYLAMTKEGLSLAIVVEGDPILFNPYGVIAVNPERYADINYALATDFIEWLTSVETQEMIAGFGVEDFGQPLFTPDSDAWRAADETGAASQATPALKLTGAVATEMAWTMKQLQAMDVVTVSAAQLDKDAQDYDGVRLNALLDLAGPNADAETLVIVADDGFEGEASLADVRACADCLVGFQNTQGGLRMVMPGMGGKAWVKGVIEIRVQ